MSKFISVIPKSDESSEREEEFNVRKSVEFYKFFNNSYRADVTQSKDGRVYVAITRYWQSPQTKAWIPTKKQICLPLAAWTSMKQAIDFVDEELDVLAPVAVMKKGFTLSTIFNLS